MGLIDHEILFKVQHLKVVKKLLLKDSLYKLDKIFTSYEQKDLFFILEQINTELKKYD